MDWRVDWMACVHTHIQRDKDICICSILVDRTCFTYKQTSVAAAIWAECGPCTNICSLWRQSQPSTKELGLTIKPTTTKRKHLEMKRF